MGYGFYGIGMIRDENERIQMESETEENISANDSLNNIQFSDIFNIEEIQHLQDLFADANEVSSIITAPDGKPITRPSNFTILCNEIIRKTEKGRANCYKSDAVIGTNNTAGPIVQQCMSCGLWDAGASITVGGKHIANWLIGQVRNDDANEQQNLQFADEIGVNRADFLEALHKVPIMSAEKFNKVAKLLFAFANELSQKAYNNLCLKLQMTEKESEEKYRFMFANNPQPNWIYDIETLSFLEVNEAAIVHYGYSKEEFLSMTLKDIRPSEDVVALLEDVKLTTKSYNNAGEWRHIKKNGELIFVEITSHSVIYSGRKARHVLIQDITDRKRAEAEILRKNEELLKVNAEKDKFFSVIAHDLRGPLSGFKGLTEAMAENSLDISPEEFHILAVAMKNSVANIFRLLGNLLEWSRMQRGLTTFVPESILLSSVIYENVNYFIEEATKKEITVSFEIPDDLFVSVDRNMLESIIRNLTSNAVKFTPRGGRITVTARSDSDNLVQISISDTGIGMNKEMIANLFRVDAESTRKGTEGEYSTGLGLVICKDFIERHGGKLMIESEVGKGSILNFTLPYTRKTEDIKVI